MARHATHRLARPHEAPAPDHGRVRCVVESVWPEIDGGRYPIKRSLGEHVDVWADVFADGHDVLGAVVCYRHVPAQGPAGRWCEAPMRLVENDRWTASFQVTDLGRYEYAVDAWVDAFASWRSALERRIAARQVAASDLAEGAALLHEAAARAGRPGYDDDARRLADEARSIEAAASSGDLDAAGRLATDPDLLATAARHADRRTAERSESRWVVVDRERARVGAWYEMFPRSTSPEPGRSGTFRDAASRLPDIGDMGFDVVYLPPIHPIGLTGRKGPGNVVTGSEEHPGSPWAIGSAAGGHTAIDPNLGTLEEFDGFVRDAGKHGLEVAMDLAYQCSPDHPYVHEHPDWFRHRPDGSIRFAENPPKKYEDIFPLDFECADWYGLWRELESVVLFWAARGIRLFRVDNPHTKPFAFWEWMIARVRDRYPDVVFLAEAFTRPKVMRRLAKLGFGQSYTYFTWRNTKTELVEYFTELTRTEMQEYYRPNLFANTPDILHAYLQEGGRPAFEVRLILAATLGATYGIYSGFELCEQEAVPGTEEYLRSEKYEYRPRDWNRPGHIKDLIRTINRLRRERPSLRRNDTLRFHETDNPMLLAYSKTAGTRGVFVVVNLDPHHVQHGFVQVPIARLGLDASDPDTPYTMTDALDGAQYRWQGERNYVRLDPATRVAHVLLADGGAAPAPGLPIDPAAAATVAADRRRPMLPRAAARDPLRADTRDLLERDALMPYLGRQRWFGGKARPITRVRFINWAELPPPPPAAVYSALADAEYGDGAGIDHYHLLLAPARIAAAARLLRDRPETVLALAEGGAAGAICDAAMDDDACRALVARIVLGGSFPAGRGVVVAHPTRGGAGVPGSAPDVGRFAPTHSNTAMTIGGRYLLKIFRRVQPGVNPDVEIGRFLASRPDVRIPALVGSLEYEAPGREPLTVAILQQFVPSRTTGWDQALHELDRAFRLLHRRNGPGADEVVGRYAAACAALGHQTATLHLALASDAESRDFAPERAGAADARAIARDAAERAAAILDALAPRQGALDATSRVLAARVLGMRPRLRARFDALGRAIGPFTRIRIHGDYHLGQVLVVGRSFVILDFEGEPLKPLAERRAKHSPLRDVAGMRRSFSYAVRTAHAAAAGRMPADAALDTQVRAWDARLGEAFLRGYLDTPHVADLLPADPGAVRAALDLYTLDKAVYELDYEMNNRPAWIHVPLAGLVDLLDAAG